MTGTTSGRHRSVARPGRSALRSPGAWLLAIGPLVFSVSFLIRSVRPIVDPLLLAIGIALIAASVATLLGSRVAAAILFLVTASTFQPIVARDISFSLAGVDSVLWQIWAIVLVVSIGWTLVAAAAVASGRGEGAIVRTTAAAIGACVGVALLVIFPLLSDQPSYGSDLGTAEIAALPEIVMVNHAYGMPDTEIPRTGTYRAKLENPSDLPHTFTVDAIDVEVYVPAGRWAIVEFDAARLAGEPSTVVCTIGDHAALGMRTTISSAP